MIQPHCNYPQFPHSNFTHHPSIHLTLKPPPGGCAAKKQIPITKNQWYFLHDINKLDI